MSFLTLVLFAVVLLPSAPSPQQTGESSPAVEAPPSSPEGTAQPLTLEQALTLAEQNSPQLTEATAQVQRAQADIQTAKAYPNPTLEVLAGHQSGRPIATPGVPGLLLHYSASQPVEIPSARRMRIHASKLGYGATEDFASGVHLSVVAEVKHAFYNVLRQKEEVNHTKENLALVADLRRRVAVRVDVGEAGRLELTRADAELARAQALVTTAQMQLAKSQASLRAAMGVQSQQNFDPQGTLEDRITLSPLPELRARVLAAHPALAEARMQVAQAQTQVSYQRALRLPQPAFYGEYEHQPDLTFYRFGVNIPVPVWDRRKGPIAAAQAEERRARAARQQRQVEIIAALERAYDQYELMDKQVQGLQAGSLHEAKAAVEAARAAYKFGERGILEVLDAQRVLQGVRDDLLDAQYGRQSALVDLEELGAISPGGK